MLKFFFLNNQTLFFVIILKALMMHSLAAGSSILDRLRLKRESYNDYKNEASNENASNYNNNDNNNGNDYYGQTTTPLPVWEAKSISRGTTGHKPPCRKLHRQFKPNLADSSMCIPRPDDKSIYIVFQPFCLSVAFFAA
jgi:hypothetical protein